uniref:Transcription elongation factor SPT5 n=1 Tax=Romanomermis culicivorax TaxID=13658 RepID=A0A915IPM2_ROMCU
MNEDEINEYFRKKYGRAPAAGEVDEDVYDDITQQGLLPSTTDPNLWLVRCRMGEEKQTALLLMRKFLAFEFHEEPLQIKSIVVKEGLKGVIYVEAYKQTHVVAAVDGVGALNMVPIKEMSDVLRVVKDIPTLKSGTFVRLKRTIFKDDLAQDSTSHAKKKRRPAQKLFDVDAIKAIGGEVTSDGDFLTFEGNKYSRKGFLYKTFPMNAIIVDGVKPTLSELEKFQEGSEDLKVELANTTIEEKSHNFASGDNVEVSEGELLNLRGKVLSVDGDKIVMMPDHEELKDPLTFSAHELRKYFREGDHVKVLAGRYEGDTGLIVKVEDNTVKVLSKDVQLCPDVAAGVDSMGQYQFGELVQLDQQTVGVIVRLEKEFLHVLNIHGKVVRIKQQAIQSKKDSKFAVALDSDQNNIMINDVVRGLQGTIKHLYRSYVFINSRTYSENGGTFVARARHVLSAGAKSHGTVSDGYGNLTPFMSSPGFMKSPQHSGGNKPSPNMSPGPMSGFGGGGAGGNRDSVRRDNSLIGKCVRITQGPMKGNHGIVKDATDQTARVELHILFAIYRETTPSGPGMSVYQKTPREGGRTPFDGAKTPMYGANTPMYGSQTPLHDGSRTPYYGSQTPLHESGSRTPGQSGAWDPTVANTPSRHLGDEYNYDEAPPSYEAPGSVNPNTPGYTADMQGPFTPAGSIYSEQAPSPYGSIASGSVGSVQQMVSSPVSGSFMAPSPAGGYAPSPSMPYGAMNPSPIGASPLTPGSFNASESGVSATHADWTSTEIEVRIKENCDDANLIGKIGIIRTISGTLCSILLVDDDKIVSVYADHLEPVSPAQHDKIKVIIGDDRETTGVLLSIDGSEGVVKTDLNDIKLYHLSHLCKFVG